MALSAKLIGLLPSLFSEMISEVWAVFSQERRYTSKKLLKRGQDGERPAFYPDPKVRVDAAQEPAR